MNFYCRTRCCHDQKEIEFYQIISLRAVVFEEITAHDKSGN